MRAILFLFAIIAFVVFGISDSHAQKPGPEIVSDVGFANVDGGERELKLDLYLPKQSATPSPCIVFIHGGGWKGGDKKSAKKNAAWLTEYGFAIASIEYRLTDSAQWPAQFVDCNAAVDWVRINGHKYNIDTRRVGAFGTSAGAHLAALLGTRDRPKGSLKSAGVQAVCDWFGPTDLLTMPPNNVGDGRTKEDVANSNGAKLLGATVREVPELAKQASALHQVSSDDDAAFLIMHGDKDPGVPLAQSTRLHEALVRAGVPSTLKGRRRCWSRGQGILDRRE